MDERERQTGDYRLLTGLALGSIVGAGLTLWLAPRAAAEIKARAVDSARSLGHAASERYRDARLRLGEAVGGIARKGQGLRNEALDKVARVAQEVEAGARGVQHFAVDAKSKVG
jgi:gas vesicle protein